MAKVLSSYPKLPGCKYRAYRHLSVLHPVILVRGPARHRSWCPVFSRWLWLSRVLFVPFEGGGFIHFPVILFHRGDLS